jgi:hypothetical protein
MRGSGVPETSRMSTYGNVVVPTSLDNGHARRASSSAPLSLSCSDGSYNGGATLADLRNAGSDRTRAVDQARATSAARLGERVVRPRERNAEPRAAVGELPQPPSPGRVAPTV